MISLLTFVQTGRLGPIGLEATRTEVELAFGPPDAWDQRFHFPSAPLWKYGGIEIHFQNDLVWMISTEDFTVPHMGTMAFDAEGINSQMNPNQVTEWLRARDITFDRVNSPGGQIELHFDTTSGVSFGFFAEDEGDVEFLYSLDLVRR